MNTSKQSLLQNTILERNQLREQVLQLTQENNPLKHEVSILASEKNQLQNQLHSLTNEYNRLHSYLVEVSKNLLHVLPGHYYSPIHSIEEIKQQENNIWGEIPNHIEGVDLHEKEQLSLLKQFQNYYNEISFPIQKATKNKGGRYYSDNQWYPLGDAVFLYCMIRHLKPKKIIEIGSGFSTCVMLDTNELFFDNSISITCIEPYPERLLSSLKPQDYQTFNLLQKNLQDVTTDFQSLEENDILFIDSTHVSKINSDVNRILFEILPSLNKGVYIHFHDIMYPFQYPKEWIFQGWAWNETYILKAFLQYNEHFKICLMNSYLYQFHAQLVDQILPNCEGGGSLWLYKAQK